MKRPDNLSPHGENAIQVVSCLDDAIDWTLVDVDEYGRTRDWALLQPGIKPGAQPTIFHLRMVPYRTATFMKSRADTGTKHGFSTAAIDAFEICVFRIDNLRQIDGVNLASFEPSKKAKLFGSQSEVAMFSESEVEHLRKHQGFEVLEEIGGVAFRYNFLDPRKPAAYPLPHSLEQDTTTLR